MRICARTSWLQCWCQLGLDICIERGAIHGTIQNPGCRQLIDEQTCDERLRAPVTTKGASAPSLIPSGDRLIFVVSAGFVDEHQPVRLWAYPRHPTMSPFVACGAHPFAQPFRRDQRFFYSEPEAMDQVTREHRRGHCEVVGNFKGFGQLGHGDVRLGFDTCFEPIRDRIQLAASRSSLRRCLDPARSLLAPRGFLGILSIQIFRTAL